MEEVSHPAEQPYGSSRISLVEPRNGWWPAYQAQLGTRIGATSMGVLAADSDFIVNRCVLASKPGDDGWGASRERSGVVMGAIQSGKTASMLAVIAKALDGGVDAIVVLAGTRTALWAQTLERFRAQLDTLPDRRHRRVMLPASDPVDDGSSLDALYMLTEQRAARALEKRLPIIAVVMKQVDHLQRVATALHDVVYPEVRKRGQAFHLLVIDDEADDSSIDESDLTAESTLQERQVPRRIVDLWESRHRPGETAMPELHATYLAYTATPQANFLQDQSNPLAPKDFVVCLRTPGADGDPDKRGPEYRVPEGLPGWYTGGDVYYRTLESVPICSAVEDLAEDERLLHGVRGYLVASAIRLFRATGAQGPRRSGGQIFSSSAEAKRLSGPVMSMLVHPSAAVNSHFDTAGRLLAWSAELPATEGPRLLSGDQRCLQRAGVEADMNSRPERWQSWIEAYRRSTVEVSQLPGDSSALAGLEWAHARQLILEEIIPATRVAVINSDVRADDRPVFEPVEANDGWLAPPNLSTIFVSGNVMSRGLTLEGLSTTVFTRTSDDPVSDTQMQMQRWFGYRGSYIDVCRVLTSTEQIALFRQYHETDLALRSQILAAMTSESPAPPTVLQGRAFKATGKIKNVREADLWPGHDPFMTYVNLPELDEHNQKIVAGVFGEETMGVPDSRSHQGRMLERMLSLTEAADLLDNLRYPPIANGGVDPGMAEQWASVEGIAGLSPGDPYFPMFRMPADTEPGAWGRECPFNIAAYLRFWALCLEDRLAAVFTTDDPPLLWSLVDLDSRIAEQPKFRVGLRFGPNTSVQEGPLTSLPWPVPTMRRRIVESRLDARWGSRNYRDGVLWGDEFFDRYSSGRLPRLTPSRARVRGADGLLLFHVIERESGVAIAPALHIPVGGPDQVHARSRRPSGT